MVCSDYVDQDAWSTNAIRYVRHYLVVSPTAGRRLRGVDQVGIGLWLLVAAHGPLSRLAGLASFGWGLVVWVFTAPMLELHDRRTRQPRLQSWRISRKLRCRPGPVGQLAKAIRVVQIRETGG